MPLKDFVNNWSYDPENFDADAFKSSLIEEFNKDESVYTSKISKLQEDGTKAINELRDTKAMNFDLLQRIPTDGTNEQGTPEPEKESTVTVSDLFGTPKKE